MAECGGVAYPYENFIRDFGCFLVSGGPWSDSRKAPVIECSTEQTPTTHIVVVGKKYLPERKVQPHGKARCMPPGCLTWHDCLGKSVDSKKVALLIV